MTIKNLQLHPQEYELCLNILDMPEPGLASVAVRFGKHVTGEYLFSSDEAHRVGEWFCRLGRELKRQHTELVKREKAEERAKTAGKKS